MRCGPIIAGEHDDADSFAMKFCDRFRRTVLHGVGHYDKAREPSIDACEHHALALGPVCVGTCLEAGCVDPDVAHEGCIAEHDPPPDNRSDHALAGHRFEIAARRNFQSALHCAFDDGRGQRMLASAFEPRREPEHIRFDRLVHRLDRHQPGLAHGQRSGLVDHEGVDFLHQLERFSVLHEHPGARAAAGADHDRHRRGKPQRARAGDDQDCYSVDDRMG